MQKTSVLLLLFFISLTVRAVAQQVPSLSAPVTLSVNKLPLKLILKDITKQTGLRFFFADTVFDPNETFSVQVKNEPVEKVLKRLLGEKNIGWVFNDYSVTFYPLAAQPENDGRETLIKGRVIDEDGQGLPGATVKLDGTSKGAYTDEQGYFSFSTTSRKPVLIITFTGFIQQEVVVSATDPLVIKLKTSSTILDETVIIAYGTTSKRLSTGSINKISASEISTQPVTNFAAALQGRVPGLEVSQSSGVAGSSFSTQIHGRNSLTNGSQALVIIDGVPITPVDKKVDVLPSIASQNYDKGGISPFNGLNPGIIESIEILKDADATAIYGSRGANGVILITTKRGAQGRATVDAIISKGIATVGHMEPLLSTPAYLAMRREAFSNDNLVPSKELSNAGYAPDLTLWDANREVNWQKFIMGGTAHTTDASVSISGGSTNTQYFGNSSFHHETSVFPSEISDINYDRGTFNFSVTHKSSDKRLAVDFNAKYATDKNILFNTGLTSILSAPNLPAPFDQSGNLNWAENGAYFDNPLADFLRKYHISTNNFLSSARISYTFKNGITLRSNFGYNKFNTKENSRDPLSAQNPYTTSDTTSTADFATNKIESYIIEPQLEYARAFPFGRITALLGSSLQYSLTRITNDRGEGYRYESLLDMPDAAARLTSYTNTRTEYRYAATFARLNYNFKNRYILNLSARRDGSSRFGPGKRSNDFGAIGAAWLFTNETFAREHLSFLSFGKIRASYGKTGNDQIGDYRYLDTWSSVPFPPYQGTNVLQPNALFNYNYSWERNTKLESAIELSTFKDRLFTSLTYFVSRSDNQLVQSPLPSTTGFPTIIKNLPVVIRNKGWELEISADVIKRALNWKVSANLTIPSNKLLSFPGISSSTYDPVYSVGASINALKIYRSVGVNPLTGVDSIVDVDRNKIYNSGDFQVLGKLDPDYYGGIRNSFRYKGFKLDILLEFKDQMAPNYLYAVYLNFFTPGRMYNQATLVENRWRQPGDVTSVQRYSAAISSPVYAQNSTVAASSASFGSGSYLKIKNVSFSYTLDKETIRKLRLKSVEAYVQGQNLFTFTKFKGFDPETPYYFSLPPLRTIKVGVQIGF